MKIKGIKIAVFAICIVSSLNSFSGVQAMFSYKQFMIPGKGIYIENYLSFISSTLKYKTPDSDVLQAKLLVNQILRRNDSIVDFKKYEVLGPVLVDSVALDFMDQKRFFVIPGEYEMEIEIMDLNSKTPTPVITKKKITIKPYESEVSISDIELIDYLKKTEEKNVFSKSGYDIYPMVSNYLATDVEKLGYYFEIYSKSNDHKVFVKQYIETYYGNKLLPSFIKRSVKRLKEVTPILSMFNITKLPSGNYNLVIEVRDSANQVIAIDRVFVQRVNVDIKEKPVAQIDSENEGLSFELEEDSMDYFLKSLGPIASNLEYKVVNGNLKKLTSLQKENYFVNFWSSRYGENAISEWKKYREIVYATERKFGNRIKRGYETDMGRVYIKYGEPNDVIDKLNEQGTYPYSIWHYYQTNNRSNVRFIFYHSTAVSEDFELIHSNMPGEISNKNWQYLLNMRVGGNDTRIQQDESIMK